MQIKLPISYILHLKSRRGFTLIEMVISIGVLAILSILVLAMLNPLQQFEKARDAQRKSDVSEIQKALEQFYQDNGKYPTNDTSYHIEDSNNNPISWGSSWTPYMDVVPQDPDSTRNYVYVSSNNQQAYMLYASLERGPLDLSTCKATSANCQNNPTSVQYCACSNVPVGATCGTNDPCNFGVSSPNTTP